MEKELMCLIDEFGNSLTKYEYYQYIFKLRDYLAPYLVQNYKNINIYELFSNEFTRNDIINSTIYYINENKNVQRISAIDDFLVAVNRFFVELIFKKYSNQNIRNLVPFTSLNATINELLMSNNITLLEKESFPPIDEDQYQEIVYFLKTLECNRLQSYQYPVIIKLMLLYGLSHDRIANFRTSDFIIDRNVLKAINPKDTRKVYYLELPYNLICDMRKLIDFRSSNTNLNSQFLFVTEGNKKISNGVIKNVLDRIKTIFENNNGVKIDRNPFTATGLQKYAIIKMIEAGINQKTITDLTGQESDIIGDCQLKVDEDNIVERNRYLNHMIRGIKTYDDI